MDVPIKNYSSGMHMRLGFAIAANLNPDVLLLDEIFAVGDDDFQKQCMATLETFQARGKTLLFVSHSAAAVQAICQRACLLEPRTAAVRWAGRGRARPSTAASICSRRTRRSDPNPVSRHRNRAATNDRGSSAARPRISMPRGTGSRPAASGPKKGCGCTSSCAPGAAAADHFVLDMGCGSLAAASQLLRYMDQGHYWGFEKNIELFIAGVQIELPRAGVAAERGHFLSTTTFDLSGSPFQYDLAIASGLFRQLPLNHVARVIAAVVRKLKPGGKFFATWMPNPDPADFAPIVHADGTTTYSDRGPYHYPFEMLASMAAVVGAHAEPFDDRSHPRGESVMVITRTSNGA